MLKKHNYAPPCFNVFSYNTKRNDTLKAKESITEKTHETNIKNSSFEKYHDESKVITALEKHSCEFDNNNSIYTFILILFLILFMQNQGA